MRSSALAGTAIATIRIVKQTPRMGRARISAGPHYSAGGHSTLPSPSGAPGPAREGRSRGAATERTTESTSGGASAAPPDTPHRPPVATILSRAPRRTRAYVAVRSDRANDTDGLLAAAREAGQTSGARRSVCLRAPALPAQCDCGGGSEGAVEVPFDGPAPALPAQCGSGGGSEG